MLHESCYGARLVEKRRKKMNNLDFQPFQVCHLKIVITHCYYYCRLGQTLQAAICTFRHEHSFPGDIAM